MNLAIELLEGIHPQHKYATAPITRHNHHICVPSLPATYSVPGWSGRH
jgi:hypothetical protein